MSGEMDKIAGRAKQAVGDLTDDEDLEREGERDELAGKAKEAVGDVEERVNETIDDVKERLDD